MSYTCLPFPISLSKLVLFLYFTSFGGIGISHKIAFILTFLSSDVQLFVVLTLILTWCLTSDTFIDSTALDWESVTSWDFESDWAQKPYKTMFIRSER